MPPGTSLRVHIHCQPSKPNGAAEVLLVPIIVGGPSTVRVKDLLSQVRRRVCRVSPLHLQQLSLVLGESKEGVRESVLHEDDQLSFVLRDGDHLKAHAFQEPPPPLKVELLEDDDVVEVPQAPRAAVKQNPAEAALAAVAQDFIRVARGEGAPGALGATPTYAYVASGEELSAEQSEYVDAVFEECEGSAEEPSAEFVNVCRVLGVVCNEGADAMPEELGCRESWWWCKACRCEISCWWGVQRHVQGKRHQKATAPISLANRSTSREDYAEEVREVREALEAWWVERRRCERGEPTRSEERSSCERRRRRQRSEESSSSESAGHKRRRRGPFQ